MRITVFIQGIPFGRHKTRGDKEAPKRWAEAIRSQTTGLTRVDKPCLLEVEFVLPMDKYPKDFPHGPDLDNLLKPLLDGLQKSLLPNDSYVLKLIASKRKVDPGEAPGAHLILKTITA